MNANCLCTLGLIPVCGSTTLTGIEQAGETKTVIVVAVRWIVVVAIGNAAVVCIVVVRAAAQHPSIYR